MPALHEVQRAFAAGLIDEAAAAPVAGMIVDDGIAAAERLRIYRNTFRSVVTDALRLSYPAVDRLVGRDFFDMAAARYIRRHPPVTGCLYDHGGQLAEFLDGFPPAAGVAYLADVARFEWALAEAANAPDAPSLEIAALAAVPEDRHADIRLDPHPSVRLLSLDFPADRIADAVLGGDEAAMAAIDLADGPVRLVVHRGADGVEAGRVDEAAYRFWTALLAGEPLGLVLAGARCRRGGAACRRLHQGTPDRLPHGLTANEGTETMADRTTSIAPAPAWGAPLLRVLGWLEAVPYAVLALPVRLGAAVIFWNSAMAKLDNWDTTLFLFAEEYRVPLLPPELAANMALAIETTMPVLLVLGLLTRPAAAVLLGMTAVIQVFVYPGSWPTHVQWLALLAILLCRGAGTVSLDHLAWRWLRPKPG